MNEKFLFTKDENLESSVEIAHSVVISEIFPHCKKISSK